MSKPIIKESSPFPSVFGGKSFYLKNIYPSPRRQILDSSKLQEFADDNFKFDENGRKFSKRVENTVGKGEIARYEQFLIFPQCFQKTCTADIQKPGLVWERINCYKLT